MRTSTQLTALALVAALTTGVGAADLRGRVVDSSTGEGLPAVTVVLPGGTPVTTDADGRFTATGIAPGRPRVDLYRIGYAPRLQVPLYVTEAGGAALIHLSPQPVVFEELVVSATRARALQGQTIAQKRLDETGPRDVGEFLRTVPGLGAVRRGGSALDLVYRGFRSEQLDVQIDGGAHVYGACPNRMDPTTSHVQSEDLEKIEVLSGPHALRFGPAFGGLVNLSMTRPPQLGEFGVETSLETGYESNGEGRRARLSATGGDRSYDFYLGAGTKDYGNYEDGDGRQVLSSSEVWDYSIKAGYRPATGERVQVSLRQSYVRDALYPSLPMDLDVDDTTILGLDYARPLGLGRLDRLTAKVYASAVDHVMSNERKPSRATMRAETTVDNRTAGGRVEVGATVLGGRAFAGADYRDLTMDGSRVRQKGDMMMHDIIWPEAGHRQIGLFAQLEQPVGTTALSVGARLDRVSTSADNPEPSFVALSGTELDRTDVNASATAGVVRHFGPDVEARVFLGTARRSPTITERYLYLLPVGLDRYDYLGNPGLDPETNLQLDVGLRLHTARLDLSVSGYAARLGQYIAARVDSTVTPRSPNVLGVRRYTNISRARLLGLEASGAVALGPGLRASLDLAYARGQDLDLDEPLPEIPAASAALALRQTSASGRYWLEVSERLAASQDRVAAEYAETETSSYRVLSLSGALRLGAHLELRGALDNALDAAYSDHLNRRQTSTGERIGEPGRSVRIRLVART